MPDTGGQIGSITSILTNSPTATASMGAYVLQPGAVLYDFEITNTTPVKTATGVTLPINWFTQGDSYLTVMKFAKTQLDGTVNPIDQFLQINVSPINSPYLSCSGCTTVDPLHLRFGNVNWATAIKNVVENAILTLTGSASNIDFVGFKAGNTTATSASSAGQVYLATYVKHQPAST
jgi:hypothetical protein